MVDAELIGRTDADFRRSERESQVPGGRKAALVAVVQQVLLGRAQHIQCTVGVRGDAFGHDADFTWQLRRNVAGHHPVEPVVVEEELVVFGPVLADEAFNQRVKPLEDRYTSLDEARIGVGAQQDGTLSGQPCALQLYRLRGGALIRSR